ncbi:type II toxin-antitoxin system VapC family toxin [uncultured Thiodictyon sp.]|uniref:type II toxin-antitoxin system VapC family toxin n=1 Tax=uncultured Thiodictyon sp. TaxID=1846217 RepID=UPI0025F22194|nr:type II toxin-antitoxin system VapC family toxin [uncultured Thiodictyon sp.]
MRYLLDTNICIHLIDRHPPQVLARLSPLPLGDAVMSVISYAELWHGVERYADEDRDSAARALRRLVARVPVLDYPALAAEHYGVLAAAVKDRRRDVMDRLIAAHALSLGLTLVTNNEADFVGYPGLTVENWVSEP